MSQKLATPQPRRERGLQAPDEVAGQSSELSGEVIGLASELFGMLDLDANGTITKEEFVNACGDIGEPSLSIDRERPQ